MSGVSGSITCPNCGNEADTNSDSRPIYTESLECLHCGLLVFTTHDYYSLIDLNERRAEQDPPSEPLVDLPKQEFRLFDSDTQSEERRKWRAEIAGIWARLEFGQIDEPREMAKNLIDEEEQDKAIREMRGE